MKQIDKLIFGLLFGCSFPILFIMGAITIWFCSFQVSNVLFFVLAGLISGILTDIVFLKKLINNALDLPFWIFHG